MTFKIGKYRIFVGSPGLTGIRWWLNVEKVTGSWIEHGERMEASWPVFRIKF